MSEEQLEQPQVSPGQLLKQARIAQKLSTQEIADRVRLKNSLIIDIEQDNYDFNISLTFLKGYLKLYAKQVGVNEDEVMQAFDNLSTQNKEPAKLQSFSRRIAHQAHDDKLMLVTYLIIAVVIALVVVWWLQQDSPSTKVTVIDQPLVASQTPTNTQQSSQDAEQADEQLSQIESTDNSLPEQAQAELNADGSQPLADAAVQDVESLLAETELLVDNSGDAAQETLATPQAQPIELVFTFSSDCWMKLTDATGEDIAYGTKTAGRVMPVTGIPPFAVILCAPEVVQIKYDGEAVDMSRFRVGATARFNLPFSE